jgi:hypothetical protein
MNRKDTGRLFRDNFIAEKAPGAAGGTNTRRGVWRFFGNAKAPGAKFADINGRRFKSCPDKFFETLVIGKKDCA